MASARIAPRIAQGLALLTGISCGGSCPRAVPQVSPAAADLMRKVEVETKAGEIFQVLALPAPPESQCAFAVIHGAEITRLAELGGGGGKIVFASHHDTPESVFVMNEDGSELASVGGTDVRRAWPDWSPDGELIAFERGEGDGTQICVMRADGSDQRQITRDPVHNGKPAWSPDGAKIAFYSGRTGTHDVYVMNSDGTDVRPVIGSPESDEDDPDWSPDGNRIAFRSTYDGNGEIYVVNADGSNPVNLTRHPANDYDPVWSPDGTKIAFMTVRDGNFDIYVMNADGSEPTKLTDYRGWDARPAWSPDGTQIVFDSDRGGQWDIYVMNADGSDVRRLTNDRYEDHCAAWCAGGQAVKRCFIGPEGGDDGWDPALGLSRPVAVVSANGDGLASVASVELPPANRATLTCEPLGNIGPGLAGLRIGGQGLTGVVEDLARGLFPRTWQFPDTPATAAAFVFLSAETGRIVSVVASPGQSDARPEFAEGRVVLRGAFIAAYNASDPEINLISEQATEVAIDAATGAVTLVR